MPSRDWRQRIQDILQSINEILQRTAGMEFEDFRADSKILYIATATTVRTFQKLELTISLGIFVLIASASAIPIPEGLAVSGVVLADQAKSFDWQTRRAEFICRMPDNVLMEVTAALERLLAEA